MNIAMRKLALRLVQLSRMGTDLLTTVYERRYTARTGSAQDTAMDFATRRFLSRLLSIMAASIRYNPALAPRFAIPVATTLSSIAADLAFE